MHKALNYMSLARRGGRIELGEEPCGGAARAGHARLIIVPPTPLPTPGVGPRAMPPVPISSA